MLGEPFFRNFYSVFDASKGVVGFAPSKHTPSASIEKGKAPADMMPNQKRPGEGTADARKKLPNMNDPISVVNFLINKAWYQIFGKK